MQPDRVAFLACGWSLAREDAHGTSIALQDDDATVLVDAGGGVAKGLTRIDGLDSLDRVYLTHEHPDHTWGFPGLVHCLRFTDREQALVVIGPALALARAREGLTALGVSYPFDIEWREIEATEGKDDIARWAPMDHSVDTVGYRIGDVTVLGDTRPTETVADLAAEGALLVHEATDTNAELCHETGHSTPSDAGEAAARANVDTLALVHIHPRLEPARAVDEAGFPDTVAPSDGDVLRRTGETWEHNVGESRR